MRPSRAQGVFFEQFARNYPRTQDDLGEDVSAAWKKHPELAPQKAKGRAGARFSKSTYHSWRRQDTSPSIHDLEILCRVSGVRQTLIVDPSASTKAEGDDDMQWHERAQDLVSRLGSLPDIARGAVLARFEDAIEKELAKEGSRNPQESDAAQGPRSARRK